MMTGLIKKWKRYTILPTETNENFPNFNSKKENLHANAVADAFAAAAAQAAAAQADADETNELDWRIRGYKSRADSSFAPARPAFLIGIRLNSPGSTAAAAHCYYCSRNAVHSHSLAAVQDT